ncbi:uncharacterized protein METZ01_LOCUS504093 [marine metagenome]|uniref:Uncharacterized protein n=1 Tax=marine metagenome TaxID=408172 RepID=A0A383E3R5_9ZZZZ
MGQQGHGRCRLYYEVTHAHIGDDTWPYVVTRYGAWKLGENVLKDRFPNNKTRLRFIVYDGMGEPNKNRHERRARWMKETKETIKEKKKVPEFVLDKLFEDSYG